MITSTRTGQRGKLRLELALREGVTTLGERYWNAPFGPVWANYPEANGAAELQITNPAGGVLGGDSYEMEVSLDSGCSATVLTQGATRIYRGSPACQRATFSVGDGAFLEYLPHHTIPYAGSGYHNENIFHLSEGATLLSWEAYSAGRVSRGERFAFDRLSSRTCILREGVPVALDGFELSSKDEPFGGYDYTGALYVVSPEDIGDLADELHAFLAEIPGTLASASAPERGLCVARLLSRSAPALYGALNGGRRLIRESLQLPSPAREIR